MRVKKNQKIQRELCTRFVALLDTHLGMTDTEVARALGYKSPATLWKIRRGDAFVDVERLVALARIDRERRPNLHWLLTGRGTPLLASADYETSEAARLIARLDRRKRRALVALIDPVTARSRRA